MPTLWVFEDQLSLALPTLAAHPDAAVLMVESDLAFRQWGYHKKRITFLCAAMRHFADELRRLGRTVHYHPLQPDGYRDSLAAIRHHVATTGEHHLVVVDPADYHTRAWVDTLPDQLGVTIDVVPNTLFLTDRAKFTAWVRSLRKPPAMEVFYRLMRVKHGVLATADRKPVGGRWNFDKDNRRPAGSSLLMPDPPTCPADSVTRAVMAEVERRFPGHPGTTAGFDYPVTRAEAAGGAGGVFGPPAAVLRRRRGRHAGRPPDAVPQPAVGGDERRAGVADGRRPRGRGGVPRRPRPRSTPSRGSSAKF